MARDWLINARGERKQADIAELAGLSQQMYSAIERGTATPSVPAAKRIAQTLALDWTRFFCDTEQAGVTSE